MPSIDLCDFLTHLGDAVKQAREGCAQANIDLLNMYLEHFNDEDFYRFRAITVKIGEELVDVPLYGMMPQGHIDLERLEVEFDTLVGLDETIPPTIKADKGNPKFSISLSRGVLSRGTEMKVKACFSLKDTIETEEQIRDKLNKLIPINHHEERKNG